jgi:hypothetical protein
LSFTIPDKPKGMHWRTYERLRRVHDAAEERSTIGLRSFVERLGRRFRRTWNWTEERDDDENDANIAHRDRRLKTNAGTPADGADADLPPNPL